MAIMRRTLEISGTLRAPLLVAMAFHAALAERDDHLRMQATVAAQKQLLDAADAREPDRAAERKDTLTQVAALKRSVQTPCEVLRELQKYSWLPQPITMVTPTGCTPGVKQGTGASQESSCSDNAERSSSAESRLGSSSSTSRSPQEKVPWL
jgi:hypothetical protein